MRIVCVLGLAALLLLSAPCERGALAQGGGSALRIDWEVKNRFRLFRSDADFQRHVAAYRNDGVLGAEQRLARDSDGRGWARDTVERLCLDRAGKLMEFCDRDGTREPYLAPRDHQIGAVLAGPVPANVSCAWSFDTGEGEPRQLTVACDEEVRLRVPYGRQTLASVDIVLPDGTARRVVASASAAFLAAAQANITGPDGTALPATSPARPATIPAPATGRARARAGRVEAATVRSTATRPAPRWHWRSRILALP